MVVNVLDLDVTAISLTGGFSFSNCIMTWITPADGQSEFNPVNSRPVVPTGAIHCWKTIIQMDVSVRHAVSCVCITFVVSQRGTMNQFLIGVTGTLSSHYMHE